MSGYAETHEHKHINLRVAGRYQHPLHWACRDWCIGCLSTHKSGVFQGCVPATLAEAFLDAPTTIESTTTSLQAVPADAIRRRRVVTVGEGWAIASVLHAAHPIIPQRARYERRLYPNIGTVSLKKP